MAQSWISTQSRGALQSCTRQAVERGNYLGHRLVVDGDQVLRLRVDLQGPVEAQGSFNGTIGAFLATRSVSSSLPTSRCPRCPHTGRNTFGAQSLATSNLAHKVRLLLLHVGGEAFCQSVPHSLAEPLALALVLGIGLRLLRFGVQPLFLLQVPAEFRVVTPLVVKVGRIWQCVSILDRRHLLQEPGTDVHAVWKHQRATRSVPFFPLSSPFLAPSLNEHIPLVMAKAVAAPYMTMVDTETCIVPLKSCPAVQRKTEATGRREECGKEWGDGWGEEWGGYRTLGAVDGWC